MESSESSPYSGRAGNSRYPTNNLQDNEDNYVSNGNQITQEVHNKIPKGDDDDVSRKGRRGSLCDYDTNSEISESSDEDASDVLSGTCEESDDELMDDDNGNDENGNIKELNGEGYIEEDEWESMDEDDDENGEVGHKSNFDIGMDSDSSNDHSERCSVCLNRFIGQIIGTPESCDHSFCLECILEWSKNVNTCPVDRRTFNRIFSRSELGGNIIEKIPVNAPKAEDEPDDDVTYCEVCRQCDREDRLLLCDCCDNGYHCECLIPPLDHIPVVEWYCPRCISDRNAEASTEENVGAAETSSRVSRIHRAIARTQASESVRHRIQQRRMANGETRSRSTIIRRRKVRRRKYRTKRAKSRKYTKKQLTGIKQKSPKKLVRKPRRKRRKLSRRKRKTRRAVATARPLIAPSIRKRIADKLGIEKPRPGQTLPQIRRSCPTRSLNSQRFDGGAPTVSLFGHRDDLDIVNEDYENSSTGGVAVVCSRVVSHPALAPYARLTGKHALSLERRIMSASPLTSTENFDVLGDIMQEQRLLYKKSHSILIQRNGCLKVKSPDDGLEQKQETDSSDGHGKSVHGNPESEEGSKTTETKNDGQPSSPNISSNVDMFDSDNNDKHEDNIELSHSAHQTNPKGNKENKSRKQRRNILNYGALQLYSDVEDDEENESLWRPVKKKRNISVDKSDSTNKPVYEENSANQSSEIETNVSSINEKANTKILEATSSNNSKLPNGAKNFGKINTNIPAEQCDNKPGLLEVDSDSNILSHLLAEKEQNISASKSEQNISASKSEQNDKEKCISDETEKKEDQNEEVTDDFTDIAPRVNISVLPKIPKIKREKDENKDEEITSESGRHSVLSKVDDGSQETRWNKLSRFNRDKNSADKTQSERSFSDHNSSRGKQENFRWSNERNRDNRHWRERDDGNWRERDDGDHYRDRRHGERQREHDRWERPWKSDQRNRFDNYNYGNDNRKKFSRDNRSSNFRDRKEFPRGRSGRSPLKEYSREKDRNLGGKGSSNERDGMYRDIPNRNYKKFTSYESVPETKKDTSHITKCDAIDREIESDITNIEKENINNDQCIDDRLLINSPLTLSVSSLNRKCTASPLEWEAKQHDMEEIEARENFWNMQEEEEHDAMQCDNSNSHFANLKNPYADTGYRKLRSPSPPSPPENESYDPFDPTESPDHKSATSQLELSLDIPLPDRSDDQQNMKPLENIDEKPLMALPPLRFPQPSYDQSNACSFVPRGSLPNVHVPPPNFIIHNVPRPPFGNMVPQSNMQPFNWSAPPPAILVPPVIRGPFLPPPLPPRMITPQCAQPQMGCLPPPGPPPGPLSVMAPRGIQNTGPFVPNLPPPPMQNLNLPPQITLTNIAHPLPPPPPPPPSSMMTSTVQNTAPPVIPSHPSQNAILPRPIFIPPTTTVANPTQDSSVSVTSNQILGTMNSPLAVSSSTSVQSIDFSNAVTTVTVPTTNEIPIMQSASKKNDATILNAASTASELPKKQIDSETTNQTTAPSDVTDIVDMEVDSPFSPTNSPIDFDDVSIASSSEKSTPSPIGRELILSSPRPKFLATKQITEISGPKSSTPLKTANKSAVDLTITENSKSNKIISCGQSLLEEVWAKHILSDTSSKSSTLDSKKKPSEKIRVVRDASAKEALKIEGSSFKMDEDQLKILDEIPSSAVEMQVKEKYMKKLNRQERVIEEVKLALKPYYNRRDIDKEEYKEILRKCVPKICHNRSGSIIPKKVKILVEAYVEKFSYHRKKGKDKPFPNT